MLIFLSDVRGQITAIDLSDEFCPKIQAPICLKYFSNNLAVSMASGWAES
jgi:hypothetical protein